MLNIVRFKTEIHTIMISLIPGVELRGAIPMGTVLGLSLERSTLISIIGNILLAPILLKILMPCINALEELEIFKKIIDWIRKRTIQKTKDKIKKYSTLGLFFFVAVPIPTTGVWTACLAASILRLNYNESLVAISMGVIASGTTVYMLLKNII